MTEPKPPEKEETKVTAPVLATNETDEALIEAEIAKKVQRRVKRETHLYSGCGFSKKKKQLLDAFWGTMWKELERVGWRKLVGVDEEEGSITFFPRSSEIEDVSLSTIKKEGKRGKDYYDRIKDVIDRIIEGRNEEEKKISELFKAEYNISDHKKPMGRASIQEQISSTGRRRRAAASSTASTSSTPEKAPTKKRYHPSLSVTTIDLSWKDGGSLYPKRSSQVGDEFQATDIPAAGTYTKGSHSDLYELIWDPKANQNDMLEKVLAEKVPHNKKEQALVAVGLMGMNKEANSTPNMAEILSHLNPVDGSDWTDKEKAKFHVEIFRLRKDMGAISKSMGKDIKTCYTYYLATYKKSDAYRLLKTVCTDERHDQAESNVHGVDACAVCGDGGSLLICDGCEGEYHMGCLRPQLSGVPEGHWECDECVDKGLLKAREYIIANSKLYKPMSSNDKKRKSEEISNDGSDSDSEDEMLTDGLILRPSSAVLTEIKKFARSVGAVFSPVGNGAAKVQTNNVVKSDQ